MAKSLEQLLEGLGPTRAKELRDAHAKQAAARQTLEALRSELADVEQELAAAEPKAMAVAGVNTATLARSMTTASALTARRAHLADVAIPATQREQQATYQVYATLVAGHHRRYEVEHEQQAIIAKAQERLEDIWAWRAA